MTIVSANILQIFAGFPGESAYFNRYQSAYWPGCSTETALQLLLDRIYCVWQRETYVTCFIGPQCGLWYIYMVDYTTLLKRLSCSFGVSGVIHSWIKSYLSGRTQSVRVGLYSSTVTPCSVGVSQGSVMGPLLFLLLARYVPNVA